MYRKGQKEQFAADLPEHLERFIQYGVEITGTNHDPEGLPRHYQFRISGKTIYEFWPSTCKARKPPVKQTFEFFDVPEALAFFEGVFR